MTDPLEPPLIRVSDQYVLAGARLEHGPLVPAVYLPLIRSWTQGEVVIAIGDRTRTLHLGPGGNAVNAAWERLPNVFGVLQAIQLSGRIQRDDGRAHRCAGCAAERPWSVEWVSGALLLTGTVECRSCWHRDRSDWAVEAARRIGASYPGAGHDGDLYI